MIVKKGTRNKYLNQRTSHKKKYIKTKEIINALKK